MAESEEENKKAKERHPLLHTFMKPGLDPRKGKTLSQSHFPKPS